jgi:lipoate---protein ligase
LLLQIDTKIHSAKWNMKWDACYLENLDPFGSCLLHFYEWKKPSISFGHFIDPEKFFEPKKLKEEGIDLARRPTGGGITFHLWDFAFSFFMGAKHPAFCQDPLENYHWVNRAVLQAIGEFLGERKKRLDFTLQKEKDLVGSESFCMTHPTRYDVILGGKKVAGAAQRKTQKGFLHQGTIFLTPPDESLLKKILLPEKKDLLSSNQMVSLLEEGEDSSFVRQRIQELLLDRLQKNLQS